MAVDVADIRQTVVEAVDTAGGVVDVKEGGVVPHFLVVCIDGVAGFGRLLELVQARRAAIAIVAHRAADAVRTAEIEFDRAFDDGADLGTGRIAPAVFKSRRGGAEEALPVARVVVEGVFPPPEFGGIPTIEQRPAEHVAVILAVHVRGKTDLFQIACAGNGARLVTGFRQRGQQHGGQNRDDRDDDQQFDQGEGQYFFHHFLLFLLCGISIWIRLNLFFNDLIL